MAWEVAAPSWHDEAKWCQVTPQLPGHHRNEATQVRWLLVVVPNPPYNFGFLGYQWESIYNSLMQHLNLLHHPGTTKQQRKILWRAQPNLSSCAVASEIKMDVDGPQLLLSSSWVPCHPWESVVNPLMWHGKLLLHPGTTKQNGVK